VGYEVTKVSLLLVGEEFCYFCAQVLYCHRRVTLCISSYEYIYSIFFSTLPLDVRAKK